MKPIPFAPALLLLAACATPLEECIRSVTHDLIVVDQLIARTQGNLDRGYAYEDRVITMPAFIDCTPRATKDNPNPRAATCFDDVSRTVTQPVAIDLAAEQVKLTGLQAKRFQLARASQPAVADCQTRYPE